MDLGRAFRMSLLAYLTSFIVGVFATPFLGYDFTEMPVPMELYIFGMVTAVIITILYTNWYFADRKLDPTVYHGILFGLTVLAFSLAFDLAVILAFPESIESFDVWSYYMHPLFIATVALIPVSSGVTAVYIHKKPPKKSTDTKSSKKPDEKSSKKKSSKKKSKKSGKKSSKKKSSKKKK